MKKFVAAMLTLVLALSLVSGVFAQGEEPIPLTAFIGEPGDQPSPDNKIYKLIEERFGIKFGFEFLAGNLDEILGLKIFSQDYPDLFNYNPVDEEHTDFIKIQDKRLPELIMCDPDQFDALWDAFVEEITPSATAFGDYMQQSVVEEAMKVLGNE